MFSKTSCSHVARLARLQAKLFVKPSQDFSRFSRSEHPDRCNYNHFDRFLPLPLMQAALASCLLFAPLAPVQAAPPQLNPITASNLLTVDPFNNSIRYGGTWGDDSSAGSPTYSQNYYHTFLGISGYAYNGTGDDPDCNALGQWSPFTCPGIRFNDTSPLAVPNGQIEWNSGTTQSTTQGTFISSFQARQTAMMRVKSQLDITTAAHHMPKFSVSVPIVATTPWKLDLKVKRVGIVEYKGRGSDYIVVRPLETGISGGTLKSGSLNLPQDTLRDGGSNGSWDINQESSAVLTGSGSTTLSFNLAYEVNSKVSGGLLSNRTVCWRAGQANGDNGNSISCNPANSSSQGVFLEGIFSYLHHLRYEFDPAQGSTCSPLPVTVKACADDQASCTTLYTGGQSIHPTATAGSGTFAWVTSPLLIPDSGSVTTQVRGNLSGVPVTLGVTEALPVQCFNTSGSPISCTVPSFAHCSFSFSVLDGYNKPWTPAKPENIYTKLAGVNFPHGGISVSLINQSTTPYSKDASYRGTPIIELVDATTRTDCTGPVLQVLPAATYTATDAGERNFALSYAQAVPRAQIRVRDTSTHVDGCSDPFSIRPTELVLGSDAMASANTARKAGTHGFSLTATARNAAAAITTTYTGMPRIDTGALHGLRTDLVTAASATGQLSLAQFPAASAGIATLNDLTYDEVGYFALPATSVYDTDYTQADQAQGDCTNDFSNAVVNGKYGCKFGNSVTSHIGRFYPDHFKLLAAPACSGGNFIYSAQPFALTLTAENGSGGLTRNYNFDDGYAQATAITVASISPAATASLNTTQFVANAFVAGSASKGDAQFTFSQPSAPSVVTLHAAEVGGDGVASNPDATMNVWSGRLRMQNAAGPNHLELYVPMQLERYEGASLQWQANSQDRCTSLALQALNYLSLPAGSSCVLDNGLPGDSGQGCSAAAAAPRQYHAQPGALATPSADFNLWLAPPVHSSGALEISPNTPAWLGSTKATVTFGNVKSRPIIYRKEQF